MKRFVIFIAMLSALLAAGCAPDTTQTEAGQTTLVQTAAVYLAPEDGAKLTEDDLSAHPEVVVVRTMDLLRAADSPQVWIDAACVGLADKDWLLSQNGVPVVIIGYGDSLYAFAELMGFPIEMPYGTVTYPDKPGFCIWLQTMYERGFGSQTMREGEELTAQAIRDACAMLLDGQS
jgi:hypothetical protein